jgi:AcrR family transcriptional regulator
VSTRPGPGRPRHREGASARSGRDDLLEAAATLFVEQGFAATSTRAIAQRAGVRQASLYYHFAGKDDLLAELLDVSVRPTLDAAAALDQLDLEPAEHLRRLVLADVRTLASAPHNIGTLYLLPEVQQPRFAEFQAERNRLEAEYARLGALVAGDHPDSPAARRRGEILLQVVEVTIHQSRRRTPDDDDAAAVAEACLRICGVPITSWSATGDGVADDRHDDEHHDDHDQGDQEQQT